MKGTTVIRTFIAVDVSSTVKSLAAKWIDRLGRTSENYRWSAPENLHVTLNFLGDVQDTDIPNICQRVKATVSDGPAFDLSIDGLGAFPDIARPRTLWMNIDDGADSLCEMQMALTETLLDLGFPKDRHRYRPHLTLGRLKHGSRWSSETTELLRQNESIEPVWCPVQEVVVYSSFLDKSGPTYTPMSRIPLN